MKMKYLVAAAAALGSTTASATSLAELAANVEASGWISGSYIYTFNDGEPGQVLGGPGLHVADLKSDSFILNQAALNLVAAPKEGFGGAVNLLAGEDAANVVNSSYDGVFGAINPNDNESNKFALQQAYMTYASGALTITAGRFNSLAGYEVVAEPLNSTLSRSLLFPNAEPYFHTGVRVAIAASDTATLYLGVNNSATFGAATDDNQQKTVEVGGFFNLSDSFTLGIYDYYGVEEAFGDSTNGEATNYLDVVAAFTASDKLLFALSSDYVSIDNVGDILGFAGYVTLGLTENLSATLRLETITSSPDGGEDVTVNEATLALKYTPAKNFILLTEARIDTSDDDLFLDGPIDDDGFGTKFTDSAPQLGVKAIYTFGL